MDVSWPLYKIALHLLYFPAVNRYHLEVSLFLGCKHFDLEPQRTLFAPHSATHYFLMHGIDQV